MLWAKAAIAGGLLLLATTFGVGVEAQATTSVGHRTYGCGSLIPSSWLVSGTAQEAATPRTARERHVAASCADATRLDRLLMWGALGLGGLAVLAGWTAVRERGRPVRDEFLSLAGSTPA